MNDYSELFSVDEITKTPYNIMGRFKRDVFKENILKFSKQAWQEDIKSK
jgi:hypothetical protein